jgi:hypothetical protein
MLAIGWYSTRFGRNKELRPWNFREEFPKHGFRLTLRKSVCGINQVPAGIEEEV